MIEGFVHVFMLVVVMGSGDSRRVQPNPLYFYDINECQYFAKAVPRQYGNYNYSSYVDPRDRITAYCKPVYMQDSPYIYK